jgi:hypothetical protein
MVSLDIAFCVFCGFALPPMEQVSSFSESERADLFQQREIDVRNQRIQELSNRLSSAKRARLNRQIRDTGLAIVMLLIFTVLGFPVIEDKLDEVFKSSPASALMYSVLAVVVLIFLILVSWESRRQKNREEVDSLESQLAMARHRLREVEEQRYRMLHLQSNPGIKPPSKAPKASEADLQKEKEAKKTVESSDKAVS